MKSGPSASSFIKELGRTSASALIHGGFSPLAIIRVHGTGIELACFVLPDWPATSAITYQIVPPDRWSTGVFASPSPHGADDRAEIATLAGKNVLGPRGAHRIEMPLHDAILLKRPETLRQRRRCDAI